MLWLLLLRESGWLVMRSPTTRWCVSKSRRCCRNWAAFRHSLCDPSLVSRIEKKLYTRFNECFIILQLVSSLGRDKGLSSAFLCLDVQIDITGKNSATYHQLFIRKLLYKKLSGWEKIFKGTFLVGVTSHCAVPIYGHIDATRTEHLWVRYISHRTSQTRT